jgi:hypothetical protein
VAANIDPEIDVAEAASLRQDGVCINHVLTGVTMPEPNGDRCYLSAGLWTLEVPDHALGRIMQRTAEDPAAILFAAHRNLLALPARLVTDERWIGEHRSFLLAAGDGAFITTLEIGPSTDDPKSWNCSARAATWVHTDMLGEQQTPLRAVAERPKRLADTWLLPTPLCRITVGEEGLELTTWRPGLPEQTRAPARSAGYSDRRSDSRPANSES